MFRIIFVYIFFVSLLLAERPNWLFGKSSDEVYIYGVGSAGKTDSLSFQKVMAEASARANLSENIKVEIKSIFEKSSGSNIPTSSSYKFIQTSNSTLKFSFVKESWVDEKSGELYILMAMEKSNLTDK
jgi:hypothetical protein